jgi:hypothetical protein
MMPAHHPEEVRPGGDGRFNLKMPQIFYAVMAMDESRQRGGLVVLPKGNSEAPVEIRLGPLVRVKGRFEGPYQTSRVDGSCSTSGALAAAPACGRACPSW